MFRGCLYSACSGCVCVFICLMACFLVGCVCVRSVVRLCVFGVVVRLSA